MDQFVCVRLAKANALDLSLFQFDYDLTFSLFMMNADKTIYARYGSRSSVHDAAALDMSLTGLAETLRAALELHKQYPSNRELLTGKQPVATQYATPDDLPSLRGKYQPDLNYQDKVVQSCLHCHQISDAVRLVYRQSKQPIPDEILFPYPAPDTVGMHLDPNTRAKVSEVVAGSAAAVAGMQAADELVTVAGQIIASPADVQWILHHAKPEQTLPVKVLRDGRTVELAIQLKKDWRRVSDASWRVGSWELRRMALGGLLLKSLPDQERQRLGLDQDDLGLLVEHVGQYGEHAVAKQAGFLKGDVLVALAGVTNAMTESQLMAYVMQQTRPGDVIQGTVIRGTERVTMQFKTQ